MPRLATYLLSHLILVLRKELLPIDHHIKRRKSADIFQFSGRDRCTAETKRMLNRTWMVIGPPGPAVIDSVRVSKGRPLLPVMVFFQTGKEKKSEHCQSRERVQSGQEHSSIG